MLTKSALISAATSVVLLAVLMRIPQARTLILGQ